MGQMALERDPASSIRGAKTLIKGIVQGVGFRPFIFNLARKYDLKGFVANTSEGVDIEVEGARDAFAEAALRVIEWPERGGDWLPEPDLLLSAGGGCSPVMKIFHALERRFLVKTLQELHCKTALEHFGAGPNSFQLLKHLPVDFLKVDGSFIHNLATDNNNQAMVKSILDTASSMNKQCIAEYVQDAHSLAVLWQSGINYIQGNFLQEPTEALNYDFSGAVA